MSSKAIEVILKIDSKNNLESILSALIDEGYLVHCEKISEPFPREYQHHYELRFQDMRKEKHISYNYSGENNEE